MVKNGSAKCPKCGSELEKVQSCCSVIWFCKKCNEVVNRFQPRFVEQIYQDSKKSKKLPK